MMNPHDPEYENEWVDKMQDYAIEAENKALKYVRFSDMTLPLLRALYEAGCEDSEDLLKIMDITPMEMAAVNDDEECFAKLYLKENEYTP